MSKWIDVTFGRPAKENKPKKEKPVKKKTTRKKKANYWGQVSKKPRRVLKKTWHKLW